MKKYPISIKPFGERAILIEWPNKVDEAILEDILLFVKSFKKLEIPGWETIPAYSSILMVSNAEISDFPKLEKTLLDCYIRMNKSETRAQRFLWKLPVCYDDEFAIDLAETTNYLNLSASALIESHTSCEYTVFGIGFLPGFMYLGGLPKTLEIPRRKEPRLHVDKGSVGLAGKQTGIYPQDSPGGWNIIGSCPIPIFNATKETPCFVNVGDRIKFQSVSRAEYDLRKIEGEVGIYNLEKTEIDA
nr:5-oxoprolinase subunit PxpB [Allomuricauda sp.]